MKLAARDRISYFTHWTFEPSGDYAADCATGRHLAREYLHLYHETAFQPLLGWITSSIAKLDREMSGIEIGFFAAISDLLLTCEISRPGPDLIVIDGGRK